MRIFYYNFIFFISNEMPKILNRTEEEKHAVEKEQKRKCYYKHKELYNLISLRSYYANRLKLVRVSETPSEEKENQIIGKLREINERINQLRENK